MTKRFSLPCLFLAGAAALASCGGGGSGGGAAADAGSASASMSDGVSVGAAPAGNPAMPGAPTPGGSPGAPSTTAAPADGSSASSPRLALGVNMHTASTSTNAQVAALLASRHLGVVRIDFAKGDNTALRDLITKVNANGGRVQLTVETSYQWDNSCSQDLLAVYTDAYNQTYSMVASVKDIAHQFEILNEIQLRPDVSGQVTWNAQGASTAGYEASSCSSTLASVAKGMADAIHAHGQQVILGAVGRDWGFLTYMQQKGVTWDVTGFHNYPYASYNLLSMDPWYGTNGPLYQLALFGKPVTINEFNCGEIFGANFENTAGQPNTEACFKGINRHLADLTTQTRVKLDSIVAYELTDEPAKAAPENHFGLMVDLDTPKTSLLIATAYAGGMLSSTEQAQITSRGLLTDAQIAAMK